MINDLKTQLNDFLNINKSNQQIIHDQKAMIDDYKMKTGKYYLLNMYLMIQIFKKNFTRKLTKNNDERSNYFLGFILIFCLILLI